VHALRDEGRPPRRLLPVEHPAERRHELVGLVAGGGTSTFFMRACSSGSLREAGMVTSRFDSTRKSKNFTASATMKSSPSSSLPAS
jgi:hypothetical protein